MSEVKTNKIKKPFYKKWWFITIVILIIVGLLFSPSEEEKLKAEEAKIAAAEIKAKEKEERKKEKAEDKLAKDLKKQEEKEAKELKEKEAKELKKQEKRKAKDAKALAKEEKVEKKKKTEAQSKETNTEKKTEVTSSAAKKDKPEKVEVDRVEEIENAVKSIIEEDLNGTSINKLLINEHMGLDDGSYIVLPHLKWDAKNGAKNTRIMLERYSDNIAAKLVEQGDVSEITVFWEVPYHSEGENIAKYMYEKSGDGMAKIDQWYSPAIR